MSEELINLEDDGPAIPEPVAEPPAAPVAAAPEPTEEPETPAEVEAVEVAGKKYVPISAVISERKQRQALAEKAARVDQLETEVADLRPYAKFLRDNPNLLQPRQEPAPVAPDPQADPEVEELARLLDLYTPDGQPDLKRAAKFLTVSDKRADRKVQQAVAPVHERAFQEKSAQNFQLAMTFKDPNGRSPSAKNLATIWRTVTAQQSADPSVASILTATALGLDYANATPQPAPPAQPPLVTEGAGGAPRRVALSDIETKVARERGVTQTAWAEQTKGFTPGRANQLED